MQRLILFLLKLVCEEFYGSVEIDFKQGHVHWPIRVKAVHIEATLPQPDTNDPVYQKLVADTVKGVS